MAQKLFSESLPVFTGEIVGDALRDSILGLKKYTGVRTIRLLQWDEKHVALSVNIPVDLPPLGNYEGIDIRSREPVLIVVDPVGYPRTAPMVFPDRLNFPKDNLAHLYVARKGKPPMFCLVRGDLSEWYSNKRLKDLFIRVGNWLRDAASGQLSEDGDQFDPVRLEGYSSSMIYDYDQVALIVNDRKSFAEKSNFAIAQFERIHLGQKLGFKLKCIITPDKMGESLEEFKKENEKSDNDAPKKNYHYGYVLWSTSSDSFCKYQVNLPEDWNGIKAFCASYGIEISQLEHQIATNDQNVFVTIPLIVAVRRPKKIIGFSGDIEFFNFIVRVNTADTANGMIINNVPAAFYKHVQPLSKEKAKLISGSKINFGNYVFVAGCGALGSKVIMHFARGGSTNFLLVDPDEVSPHNLVRHALFGNSEGLNKADALHREIKALYPHDNLGILRAAPVSATSMLGPDLAKFFNWVLDFTASHAFGQTLIQTQFEPDTRIVKASITDFGNLGALYFEGKGRNPRVDDLQVMLYSHYDQLPLVSSWLGREADAAESNNLSITVGVGCNSETTVLPDDIVSLHAAYIASVIKAETNHEQATEGKIFLNEICHDPFFANRTQLLTIQPLDIVKAVNDPTWEIRIKHGIIDEMKREMGLAMPSETGGVFAGRVNFKTKTIHVTELIKAPSDSKGNAACFFRGVEGLPDKIGEINAATGNQLGYIGEWHTHPFGPNAMSTTDAAAIRKFKKEFDTLQTPLPVFLLIVTPDYILPYVY